MKNDYFQPLDVNLTGPIRHYYNEKEILPVHKLVVKPLLEKCIYAYVRGLKKDDELYRLNADILIYEKGKFKFDTIKECLLWHEYLWNATGRKRGSIVIVLEDGAVDFSTLFKNTYNPGLTETPNMGNSLSATKKCRDESDKGNIAICFPASNGLEWMSIYAKGWVFTNICEQAYNNCQQEDFDKYSLDLLDKMLDSKE